jgi:hypothetical protein
VRLLSENSRSLAKLILFQLSFENKILKKISAGILPIAKIRKTADFFTFTLYEKKFRLFKARNSEGASCTRGLDYHQKSK